MHPLPYLRPNSSDCNNLLSSIPRHPSQINITLCASGLRRDMQCSGPSQDMQGVLSFVNDENANKRRKALRACQRCKESKVSMHSIMTRMLGLPPFQLHPYM